MKLSRTSAFVALAANTAAVAAAIDPKDHALDAAVSGATSRDGHIDRR